MDDSLQERIGEMVVNTTFDQVCWHVCVVLFLLDFDKHLSLFIQLLHT